MIIPNAVSRGPTSDTNDKWYLSYFEECNGRKYPRYISQQGWKLTATYFDTPDEAMEAFNRFNQSPRPVEEWEFENQLAEEKLLDDLWASWYLETD